jgi:hypothetical protein
METQTRGSWRSERGGSALQKAKEKGGETTDENRRAQGEAVTMSWTEPPVRGFSGAACAHAGDHTPTPMQARNAAGWQAAEALRSAGFARI